MGLAIVDKDPQPIRVASDKRSDDDNNLSTKIPYEHLAGGSDMTFEVTDCERSDGSECPSNFIT